MKMFYSAYTNKGNVGDLLITKFQIEEYAKYGIVYVDCHGMPEAFMNVVFDTNNPNIKNFEAEYGMTYRSRRILRVISLLNKNGFTHIGGIPGPRESLSLPLKTMCFKMMGAIVPSIFFNNKIKNYALGVDVNFNNKGFLGYLNRCYFGRFDVLGIRSESNLRRVEHSLNNVMYVPDMAFLYPSFSKEPYSKANKRIAISFRYVDNYDVLIRIINIIGAIAIDGGYGIDMVYQVDEDRIMCERILRDIGFSGIILRQNPIDYYSLDTYQKYDMVISNRLHVLLLAALNGAVPFGLISNDNKEQKIYEIINDVFGKQYVTYIDFFDKATFASLFNSCGRLKMEICQRIINRRKLCRHVFDELFLNK